MENRVYSANKDEFYPPIPTKRTQRKRTNFIIQLYHFFRLNLKIPLLYLCQLNHIGAAVLVERY